MSFAILHLIFLLLAMEFSICCCGKNMSFGCIPAERKALLKFKASLVDPYNTLSSWRSTTDCCAWRGVGCDQITRHVIKLEFKSNYSFDYVDGLASKQLDSSLLELKHLRYLDLSFIDFQHTSIPAFIGSMKQLQHLNLSNANFWGAVPHHLGNLSNLRVLDINDASQTLEVDDLMWASNLSLLEYLDMSGVDLSRTKYLSQVLFNMLPSILVLRLSRSNLNNTHLPHSCLNYSLLTNIQHLDLSYNSFSEEFPCFLHVMTSLKVLDLSGNKYNSSSAHLHRLRDLVHLNLGWNQLHHKVDWIFEFIWDKCYLVTLNLAHNGFYGEISGLFRNSSVRCWNHKLETLDLSNNELYGHFPNELGEFNLLKILDLSYNSLDGPIPTSFGSLKALRDLWLHNNRLSGAIPTSLGQLSNLERIDISSNSFKATLSESHFAKLSKLKIFNANSINLSVRYDWEPPFQLEELHIPSCKIGGQFPQWIQTQRELKNLGMPNCSISGTLPKWLHSVNLIELDLSHNYIEGEIPKLAPTMMFLVLSYNMMNGSIPHSLCKLKNLHTLDLAKNYFWGNIPNCWGNIHIVFMRLSSNKFHGVIPNSIGEVGSLRWLRLNNNSLTGQLPYSLKNCVHLEILDVGENKLSGNLPDWIGTSLPNLKFLRLRSNKFNGIIPRTFCELSWLHVMDLANNKLTGDVPHCFGNLSGMANEYTDESAVPFTEFNDTLMQVMKGMALEYTKQAFCLVVNLDLSNNDLGGEIPWELTKLSELIGLNLSHNHLGGEIPRKIGDLKSLTSLDLSSNNLIGTIPDSLSELNFLSYLNLSHNILSGPIPTGSQLQTLENPSIYDGNPGLCGPPLLKKCPDDGAPTSPDIVLNQEAGEEVDRSEENIFHGVLISGFATGFLGIVVVLVFKERWRRAYFQFGEMLVRKMLGP